MNESDIHLKLLANVPIQIDGIGEFQLPTIREVISMGESVYHEHLSRMLFDKSQLTSTTEEMNEYSDFEVLVNLMFYDPAFRKQMFDSFRLHMNSEPKMLENGVFYFDELSEDTVLTEEKWKLLKQVVRLGNYVPEKKEDEYNFANNKAKELLEMIKKKQKSKPKIEEKINTHSIISAVAWRTSGMSEILNLTIYQLYDAYYRLGFIDNYHYTFTGIYTGNIDSKKIKLPDINWANVIKIK